MRLGRKPIDRVNIFIDFVEGQLDLELSKVMLMDSICSDDVNSIQYPARTYELLGSFKMGVPAQSIELVWCGKGALGKLQANQIQEGNVTDLDDQMNTIEQILLKEKERIEKAEIPLKEATEVGKSPKIRTNSFLRKR